MIISTSLLAALACTNGRPEVPDRSSMTTRGDGEDGTSSSSEPDGSDGSGSTETGRSAATAAAPDHVVLRNPEQCPYTFKPSLIPVPPPKIQPRNSAQRVQRLRSRIERIDAIEASTYRVLFGVDDETIAALRRTPDDPPIDWRPNSRTASLPAWPVALLFHISGEPLPFLGWFFDDGDVYFVNEADPWDVAVFEPDGEKFRDVYAIPTNDELAWFLEDRLGERDPFDKLAWQAHRAEDRLCGRVSQRKGEPFPHLPKALIEPMVDEEP